MNVKLIKYILMILFICTAALFVQVSDSYAAVSCEGAYQAAGNQDDGLTPSASGLFDDKILNGMHVFMVQLYTTLAKPLMIGHSLMCYADQVAYTCVGIESLVCIVKLMNINLFISGLIIYIVGVLMIMSIGMYFVDISFKLGFAMLFMPISIALWPFPPTKNKLGENLSIIIRNGMLFALLSIGVAVAMKLIESCLFPSGGYINGEEGFWNAIANKSTDELVANFAFDELHFLIMGFGLIFAFKILASSINDYLDYFFSDSVFGSESPMHHMGTQAIGLVKANTVDRAASYVTDVAKTQTGRAIAGVGGGIVKLGSSQGRKELADSIKKGAGTIKRVVTNPRQSYNNVMKSTGDAAEKVITGVGSGVKGLVNSISLIAPVKESTRENAEKWLNEKIDKGSKATGKWVGNKIAHGGGEMQNLAADTVAAGINAYNEKLIGDTSARTVTRDDVKKTVGESLNSVRNDINEAIDEFKQDAQDLKSGAKDKAGRLADKVGSATQNTVAHAAAGIYNEIQDLKGSPENSVSDEGMRMILSADKQKLAAATKKAWKDADKAPVSLQPSALLKAPFKIAEGLGKTVRQPVKSMEKLANTWEDIKRYKDHKVLLKKTGQIVLRSAASTIKGTGQDVQKVAEGTASAFGNILKDFGKSMQDNSGNKDKGWTSWKNMHEAEERKKAASQEDRSYFNSLENRYDNDK